MNEISGKKYAENNDNFNGDYRCINCEKNKARKLYCSDYCAEYAEKVRYARRKRADGTSKRPDIASVLQSQKITLYLGGGHDNRKQVPFVRRIEVATRQLSRNGSAKPIKASENKIEAGIKQKSIKIPCN